MVTVNRRWCFMLSALSLQNVHSTIAFAVKNCPQRQDALLVNVPDHVATYLTFNGFLVSTSTLASVD